MTHPLAMVLTCWIATEAHLQVNTFIEGAMDHRLEGRPNDNPNDPRPRERVFQTRGEVFLRLSYAPQPWLIGTASILMAASMDMERPPDNERFFLLNGTHLRSFFDEQVGETHMQWQHGEFTIRTGKQFVRWGAVPYFSPNDVIDRLDLRRGPFVRSANPDAPHIPLWALRSMWERGSLLLEAVWVPVFQPHRMDMFGHDFALIAPELQEDKGWRTLIQRLEQTLPASLQRWADPLAADDSSKGLASGIPAARFLVRGSVWQAGLVYSYGYEPYPFVKFNTELLDTVIHYYEKDPALRDPRTDFDNVIVRLEAGEWFWSRQYRRMHHLGLQGEATLGDFHIALDFAYSPRRTLYARSGRAANAQTITGAATMTWVPTENFTTWAGLFTMHPWLAGPRAELLFGWTHRTLIASGGLRVQIHDHWRFLAVGTSELDRRSYAVTGSLHWERWAPWKVYLAFDWFDGATETVGGRWSYNDQIALGGMVAY